GKDGPAVGGSLSVIGRVRGRGIMGNVTLDPCVRTLAAPEPVATPVPVPEPVTEKLAPPVVIPEPVLEPVVEPPLPDAPTKPPVARVSPVPSSKISIPTRSLPAAEPVVESAASDAVKEPRAASPQSLPMETSAVSTISVANYLPLFVASAIGMGVGAFLVFMKMRAATAPAFRSASGPTPEEERRAALEALLL